MKTLILAGILVGLCAMPGRAEETGTATYSGDINFVNLDIRGSRGQVNEYNGKLYRAPGNRPWGWGGVSVGNQGSQGLINLDFKDIGSTEENGSVFLDLKDWFKASVKYDRMTHRQNMTDYGLIINGQFVKIPANQSVQIFAADTNMLYTRAETDVNFAFFNSKNTAQWLSLGYWSVRKKGTAPNGQYVNVYNGLGSTLYFGEANVDNTTNEIAIGVGHNMTSNGAMSLDITRREFIDESIRVAMNIKASTQTFRPAYPRTQLTAGEMKFRYNASKDFAITGALTARQRANLTNQYKFNAAVAAFNATYKATDKMSLAARLYARVYEIDENQSYKNILNNNLGDSHQMDKMMVKGDFTLSYRPCKEALVKVGYKIEATHRRDAPSQIYAFTKYTDGTITYSDQLANSVARDDVKHTGSVKVQVELPLGIETDADYKRMAANRAAFVNMPTQSDEANLTVHVPLPGHLSLYTLVQYLNERNNIEFSNTHLTRNGYRTGLDWETENRVFIGADASYETSRRTTNGWFGASSNWNAVQSAPGTIGYEHVGGMYNRQNNATTGLHARVNLPKGFVVKANGSYTRSTVATPVERTPPTNPGFAIGDLTPGDVRIVRSSVGVDFTPENFKNLMAHASYRVDDWVDKLDANNSGRASIAQVGATLKF